MSQLGRVRARVRLRIRTSPYVGPLPASAVSAALGRVQAHALLPDDWLACDLMDHPARVAYLRERGVDGYGNRTMRKHHVVGAQPCT